MKIVTLIENELGENKNLFSEHGLSFYIEIDGKNILFDTGQTGKFVDNARKLDIDLKNLDYVIISHGHYDHSGGFKRLVNEINPDIELFVGKDFFNEKYSLRNDGNYEYTGNSFNEDFLKKNNIKVNYIEKNVEKITDNLSIYSNFNRNEDFSITNQTMYIKKDDNYIKDNFYDEISIGINTEKGVLILVGCSHPGIANIVNTIAKRSDKIIYGLMGGTHLVKEDTEKINDIIDNFKEKGIEVIGANHCTGKQGLTMFYQQMEKNFIENNTGYILEI